MSEPMTRESAINVLGFLNTYCRQRKNWALAVEASDMAIAALRREGELVTCLTMFVLDNDISVNSEEFFGYLKANGRDVCDPDGESSYEFMMRRSSKVLGREWEPLPLPTDAKPSMGAEPNGH